MGSGKLLAALGALVVATVSVGLWLCMSDVQPADDRAEPEPGTPGPAAAKPDRDAPPKKGPRRHAKIVGSCEVSGIVKRRKEQAPATGQQVTLTQAGVDPWTTECDATGAFVLPQIPDGGPYEIAVASKGCATIRLPGIVLSKGEKRDVGTLWLDQAVSVTVNVRTWADAPIAGADVEAFTAPDTLSGNFDWTKAWAQIAAVPVAVAKATTDAEGKAAFPELASGTWTFVARKSGFSRDGRSNVRLAGGEEPPPVKIYLSAGHTLTGRVLDGEKKAIAKAVVLGGRSANAWDFGAAALRSRAVTADDGHFELTDLATGDVALLVGRAGGVPSQVAIVRVPNVKQYDVIIRDGGTLQGTVTESSTGKPVDGATVRASSQSGRMAEATTNAEGKYVIAAVPDGTLNGVSVSKEGWLQDTREETQTARQFSVPSGSSTTRDLKMRQGAKVSGTVSGPAGPIAGARVQVWVNASDGTGVSQSGTAATDAAGAFSIVPVVAGRAMVRATRDGYIQPGAGENPWMLVQQGNVPVQMRVDVPESGEARIDVKLEPGARIEGRVETSDGPLAAVNVTMSGSNGKTKTSNDGAFAIDGATPGTKVGFSVQKDGYLPSRNEPVQVLPDQPTTGVVLKMVKQKKVKGKVTSAAGLPLRDGQVFVIARQPGNRGQGWGGQEEWNGGGQGSSQTPSPILEDGSFEVPIPMAEGSFVVSASALDHATGESSVVTLVETQSEYQATVVLESGYSIRGRVAAKGVAVAGAEITSMSARGGSGAIVAVTDAEGSFVLSNLTTGKYWVSARAYGYVPKTVSDIAVPGTSDVTVEIEPGLEISGKVLFNDARPAAGAIVSAAKDEGGARSSRNRFESGRWGGNNQVVAGPDGSFKIRDLASGNYKLTVSPPWDGSLNLKSKVTDPVSAGTSDYKLVVDAGAVITGRVLDPDSKPVARAWVGANPAKPDPANQWRNAQTKADGTFELAGLGDGPYHLNATPPQSVEMARLLPASALNVAVGSKGVELTLGAGLSIEGVLADSNGKGLPDANLTIQGKPNAQGEQPNLNWQNANTSTDATGHFRFQGLAPGVYVVTLQSWQGSRYDGLVLSGADELSPGTTDARILALPGEKLGGVVVDESGQALGGANIWVNSQSGVSRSARADKDGRWEVSGLPRQPLWVSVNVSGRPPVQLEKIEAGNLGMRIVIPRGGTLTGRLLDAAGAAAANQQLMARKTDGGNGNGWAQTGADGRFSIDNLPEGTYELSLNRAKADGNWEQVKVGSGRTGEAIELRIP
ncbi:MAG: carboxypeptidase-like regulatory domain-containing protein [Planctomycetes bacterium]|nr:carboxypeptidase-like regulatory domain-containing protein [Planctomycetota bacterium]